MLLYLYRDLLLYHFYLNTCNRKPRLSLLRYWYKYKYREREPTVQHYFLAIDEVNKIRCSWFGSRLLKEYLFCTGVLRVSVEIRLFLVMEFFLPYTSYDSTLHVEMYISHGIICFNTISIVTFCIFLHIVEIQ